MNNSTTISPSDIGRKVLDLTEYSDKAEFDEDSYSLTLRNLTLPEIIFEDCKETQVFKLEFPHPNLARKTIKSITITDEKTIDISLLKELTLQNCNIKEFVICQALSLESITLEKCTITKLKIFNNSSHPIQLERLEIKVCLFLGECNLNFNKNSGKGATSIEKLNIASSIFEKTFKAQNITVKDFTLFDCSFEKEASFAKSTFGKKEIKIESNNFEKIAIFDGTIFQKFIDFKNTSFQEQVIFTKADFQKGLNLEHTNIVSGANFYQLKGFNNISIDNLKFSWVTSLLAIALILVTIFLIIAPILSATYTLPFIIKIILGLIIDICIISMMYRKREQKTNIKDSSQETYRIIKHHLKKVDSIIESNIYHSLELDQATKNACWNNLRSWPFIFHYFTSLFSQSWLLPLLWIYIISLITSALINQGQPELFPASYMYILNRESFECSPAYIMLFNKAALSYLYYQFIIAVRRNTRG